MERAFSFRTRIGSLPSSSGLRFYGVALDFSSNFDENLMKNRGMSGVSGLPGTVVRAKFQAVRTAHLGLSSKLLEQKYEEPRQIQDPAFSGLLEPPVSTGRPGPPYGQPRHKS